MSIGCAGTAWSATNLELMEKTIHAEIEEAVDFAKASPFPARDQLGNICMRPGGGKSRDERATDQIRPGIERSDGSVYGERSEGRDYGAGRSRRSRHIRFHEGIGGKIWAETRSGYAGFGKCHHGGCPRRSD